MGTQLSEFRARKLARLFKVYDHNKDGLLQLEDYMGIATALAKVKGKDSGSAEHEALKAAYTRVWESLGKAGAVKDGNVTLEGWTSFCSNMLSSPDSYDRMVNSIGLLATQAVDDDADGIITAANWESFFKAFRITDSPARDSFSRIDLDKDGKLTKAEVLTTLRDFFYSEDAQSPGNWFFGAY
jgi:Ca2+-binding EF-hand superfamily protein